MRCQVVVHINVDIAESMGIAGASGVVEQELFYFRQRNPLLRDSVIISVTRLPEKPDESRAV